MDSRDHHDLLQRFLAERDAACPACGYNLRGVVGEQCPECARPIALGIARTGPGAALTWFLLLAFGWVFAAGAMNTVRNAVRIDQAVTSASQFGFTGIRLQTLVQTPGGGLTVQAQPAPPVAAGYWQTAWNSVPLMLWLSTAWAAVLALGCAAGLLLMAWRHRWPFTARGERRLIQMACGLFGFYSCWHLVLFVLDFS